MFPFLPGISTLVPGGYVVPSGLLGVTITSPVFGSWSNSTVGVLRAGVVTSTGLDGLLFGSATVPIPGLASFGSLSFGTVPEPSFSIVTSIVFPSSPGISTLIPGGYVVPSGFLGVTTASPFGFLVITISPGCSVCDAFGSSFFGVFTWTSSGVLPGSVILAVPGTSPSGKSLFGTLPFPSFPIVTVIGFPFSPGISTFVFSGYNVPSGFLGVTVTSPVFWSWSNSTVGFLRAGVVTSTGLDGLAPGSVTVPFPGISCFGSLSFGTVPKPSFPIITTIVVPFSPGIFTLVPGGYGVSSGFLGVTIASPFSFLLMSIPVGCSVAGLFGLIFWGVSTLTSSAGFPGSVILPVPGVSSSGKSLFGTVPFPSFPIITSIVFPSFPGISTLVFSGYSVPFGFLGVTVTSPVFGFCSISTVGVLRAGVVTATGCDVFLFGSVTVPFPGTSYFGSWSFGTSPEPFSPIVTTMLVPFSPGIFTFVSLG